MKIGKMELSGPIVMPPIATLKCDEEGEVTSDLLEYYEARAKNPNISMIITEHAFISNQGKASAQQMSCADDRMIPGLKSLVDVIHKSGTKAICQINHAGSRSKREVTGEDVVGPSAVINPATPEAGIENLPRELSAEEIEAIPGIFAAAARRAKEAGYDGVEIHSAHSYLLNQFYSPLSNKRTDEYGGSLDNRIKLHLEVIEAVRREVGDDFIVAIRLGGSDYMEGGSTIEDAVYASRKFAEAGVDLIDLTGGMCRYTLPGRDYPGYFKDMSLAVKKALAEMAEEKGISPIPVMVAGGVKTLADANALLEEGACDIIGVGREMLKNPEWEA